MPVAITVQPTRDVAALNAIINDPAVRPFVGHPDAGPLDVGPLLDEPDTIALAIPYGAFVLTSIGEGALELHTMILPEGRGRNTVPAIQAACRYAFSSGCKVIATKTAHDNPAANLVARRAGFEPTGDHHGHVHFSMTLDRLLAMTEH